MLERKQQRIEEDNTFKLARFMATAGLALGVVGTLSALRRGKIGKAVGRGFREVDDGVRAVIPAADAASIRTGQTRVVHTILEDMTSAGARFDEPIILGVNGSRSAVHGTDYDVIDLSPEDIRVL